MSFIDRTYFVGELNIPNTSTATIGSLTDLFIEKYEEQFLIEVLGYSLWKALKAGLQILPVAQKWTDLIEGVEYINSSNKTKFWKGFISQPPSVINALDALNTISIKIGAGGTYDPVAGNNSTTIPAALVGKDFILEQRGVGQLLASEYNIVGNILTLTTSVFAINDIYIYKSATLAINTSTGTNKQSPIANYVYYWYIRNNHTQTASTGETKGKHENADWSSVATKLTRAWNEMSCRIKELVDYLNSKKDDYPDWSSQDVWCMLRKFRPINEFNI